MAASVSTLILNLLKKQKILTTSDIVHRTGFSRAYVHRHFKELQDAGRILLIGRADQARYVLATAKAKESVKAERRNFLRTFQIKHLQEDRVWTQIVQQTGILHRAAENIVQIVEYGFTEMLNNAIDHSRSKTVQVRMTRTAKDIRFSVIDKGVGIFRNIKEQRKLKDEKEAIQDLLKGKQTTAPEKHSGEGIFFTSRAADRLIIKSSGKRLIFDNRMNDVIIDKTTVQKGTTVDFLIEQNSSMNLTSVFRRFSGEEYEFAKTDVRIALYKAGRNFISRSQARRVLAGLDTFKHLMLDFQNVETIGQGFADEVFRVWKQNHPQAVIEIRNAHENVKIMIDHVQSKQTDNSDRQLVDNSDYSKK
jgi:anti-sigma regulatory factor (Ser/Thr protein kinase)